MTHPIIKQAKETRRRIEPRKNPCISEAIMV